MADDPAPDAAAADFIAAQTGVPRHDVAVVLGSGWSEAMTAFGTPVATLTTSDVPGFAQPSAAGHAGTITSARVGEQRVLILAGRTHAYEGHPLEQVVHPVRTAASAGCTRIILTNAAGGVNRDYRVGQPVLICDQLNLTGRSPLVGAHFVDMVDAYSPALRAAAQEVHAGLGRGPLAEGVYAGLPGPQYETPAEIRMLATLGADLVGMSTVHETIAARAAGLDVLGLSLVTNLAAGITGQPLSHAEVLESGRDAAAMIGTLLAGIVGKLDAG
ncbi:purine-nucleoside phosphorylase [Gordonia sp. (in: high G+C Gram-positive bacteria)]|uniref:purine-nucleoside phosphorylase n=1 Tax=Gordonia sp. (in: high G+C Gram-positive bacteria) TaxID=84139 RepID=UPI0039E32FEF